MLRFNVLAVICLGLLASCGPAEPGATFQSMVEEPTSAGSLLQMLNRTPLSAQIQVSPSSLDFGKQKKGAPSSFRTLTLTNQGDEDLTISAIEIKPQSYSMIPNNPFDVSKEGTVPLQVTFTPASLGQIEGTIKLISNAPSSPTIIKLIGVGVASAADVSPEQLDFGDVTARGPSVNRQLTVRNVGNAAFTITPKLSDTSASFFSFTPETEQVPGGGSKTFTVSFHPQTYGLATASLTFSTNETGQPSVPLVQLRGTGVGPIISVEQVALAFGEVQKNTSTQQTVTVSNTGTGTLTISSIATKGAGSGAYGFAPDTLSVPAGESQNVTVTFTPTIEGSAEATLVLTTNDVTQPEASVTLSGRGVNPSISVLGSMAFGGQRAGTSAAQTLTVRNPGTGSLVISGVELSDSGADSYSVTPSTLTVPEKMEMKLEVVFAPFIEGPVNAKLTLTTNSVAQPNVAIFLSGIGEPSPGLQLSATELDFGSVMVGRAATPVILKLSSVGISPVKLKSLTLEGTDSAAFSMVVPSPSVPLQPGDSVGVPVMFLPDAERKFSALLRLEWEDSIEPGMTVSLAGTGTRQPIRLSETALEFGTQFIHVPSGPRKVRIINDGLSPATLLSVVMVGAGAPQFKWAMPALPLVLAPGQEQEVEVTFTPAAEAEASSRLELTFKEPVLQLKAALHGRGISSMLSFAPAALDFGNLEVDEPSEPKSVTLKNTSSLEQRVVVKLRDTEGSPFSVDVGDLANPIPAGGEASFKVSFQPTVVGDAQNEVQVWLQGAAEPSARVLATGTGTEAQGGCSCGSTESGSSGMLALLAVLALGSRRWRSAPR